MAVNVLSPVRKRITVRGSQARAFEVFTAEMTRWWNPTYSIASEPLEAVVLEPREGGRWFERGTEGGECDWGRVLVWAPPERLVLAWQIDAAWSHDPALQTEIEVRFVAVDAATTRVELEHRGMEAFGEAAETMRGVLDGPNGWQGLLERWASATAAPA